MTAQSTCKVALKRVAAVMPSNVDKHSVEGERAIRLCNYVDVYRNERITHAVEFMEATASGAQIDRFTLRTNDVIVTKDSEEPTDIGIPAYVPEDMPGVVCGYHLAVLRGDAGQINGAFLHWALQSSAVKAYFATAATGISRYALSVRDIGMTPISLPPLSEQQRIANFLDEQTARIDALIAEKERLVGSLNENQQSHLLALVTGQAHGASGHVQPDRPHIEALPKDWKLPQLARLVSKLTNGYVGPTRDIFVENGVRYLQSLHIKGGFIDFGRGEYFVTEEWSSAHQKSVLTAGDVLIVQTGDIGQTALVTPDFVGCNCHALIIATPRRQVVRPEYLELVLRSPYGRASFDLYSTGALHPHLNCSNIRDIRVPLPPLFVQDEIVQRCAKVQLAHRELLSHVSGHIERLREYRSSLISAAVTGQLDIDSFEPQQVDSCEVALT